MSMVPGSTVPQVAVTGDTHRDRLVGGMVAAVTEHGYPATTIADIVRHARVSKRTFYEHFADKQECFLATYVALGDALIAAVAEAAAGEASWQARLHAATEAYLSALQAQPALTRTLLTEILSVGPAGLRVRREVLVRFADALRALVAAGRAEAPEVRELTAPLAMALVGGINELVLQAVEQGRAASLTELAEPVADLVRALLTAR